MNELSLAERYLILIQHPIKSRYRINDQKIAPGLIGAMLLDLALEEKISMEGKYVRVKASRTSISMAHTAMLTNMYGDKKQRTIKRWISRFSQKSRSIRHLLLRDLDKKRWLKLEEKRFLFIPYKRASLINKRGQENLINELRDTVLKSKEMDMHTSSLLGLIAGCKIPHVISNDKSERKMMQDKLKKLLESNPVAQDVGKVIREMQVAVSAAIISSVAVTAATAGS